MKRVVKPELLDALPPEAPEARRSRRDLLRVNALMGNAAWFARTWPQVRRACERLLELGAGEGVLARRLGADGLDRCPAPAGWAATAARWHQEDLRTFNGWDDYAAVAGNLILHHLQAEELAALGARLQQAPRLRVLLFSEPRRSRRLLWLWRLGAGLGGAGPVTRHDGAVSIVAGFARGELPELLGLDPEAWDCTEPASGWGAYRLVAVRRERGQVQGQGGHGRIKTGRGRTT